MSGTLECKESLARSNFGTKYPRRARMPINNKSLKRLRLSFNDIVDEKYAALAKVFYEKEIAKTPQRDRQQLINDYAKALSCLNKNQPPEKANLDWLDYNLGRLACNYVSDKYCAGGTIKYRKEAIKQLPPPVRFKNPAPKKNKVRKARTRIAKNRNHRKKDARVAAVDSGGVVGKRQVSCHLLNYKSGEVFCSVKGLGLSLSPKLYVSLLSGSDLSILQDPYNINFNNNSFHIRLDLSESKSGQTYNLLVNIGDNPTIKTIVVVPKRGEQ
ncbi:MAG: hypothetical protein HQ564_05070 [Candidatus Saganbacteria bacterium]|nr:hypothetical protein [Candidatus Saganbacteria bacterium]